MTGRLLLLLTLVAAVAAGCGSAGTQSAASSADVDQLLRETFANLGKISSATVDAQLAIDGGGQTIGAHLSGPFQSQGAGKLPKFRIDATLTSGGHSFSAGATWTGDHGFVAVQGTQYALSPAVERQLQSGYAQSLKSSRAKQGNGAVLSSLGIDFTKWLKNARNAGDTQVGGTDTIELTGDADVPRVVSDLEAVAGRARSLNLPGATKTPQFTAAQRQQLVNAVKRISIQVYTGKADHVLRRIVVAADLQDPTAKTPAHLSLDLTLSGVGADQQIVAPTGAKPFAELLKLSKGLSGLGALSSPSGGQAKHAQATVQSYAKCVEKAAGDQVKLQRCAALIGSG
jgi:hypothetical protein